jgi:BirA family biotin operon repressor/biotin-[acetyl-CoA-carboxylase] ligase
MPSRRAEVASALAHAGAAGLSGEHLAEALGISRVAIGKHVAALRRDGYAITALRGVGYRLDALPALLAPVEVERLVADPLWVRIEGGAETGSTNDDCKVLARAGAPEGTVVLAARQTAGRGRLGRSWVSPEGGAYVSVLLRPRVRPELAPELAPAVALGIAEGLESLGVWATLKWPNDVLAGGGKLAGVLLEMSAEIDCVHWVVAGCGINVTRPSVPVPGAAYVSDTREAPTAAVAAALLDGIARVYREVTAGGFAAVADRYRARHALRGSAVVRDLAGAIVAEGVIEGVDDHGRLLVRGVDGITAIVAGEVTLRS